MLRYVLSGTSAARRRILALPTAPRPETARPTRFISTRFKTTNRLLPGIYPAYVESSPDMHAWHPGKLTLVCKPEIQPLVPLVPRGIQVVLLLLVRHGAPFLLPDLVAPHIVRLHQHI